jgi:hypothetical protein
MPNEIRGRHAVGEDDGTHCGHGSPLQKLFGTAWPESYTNGSPPNSGPSPLRYICGDGPACPRIGIGAYRRCNLVGGDPGRVRCPASSLLQRNGSAALDSPSFPLSPKYANDDVDDMVVFGAHRRHWPFARSHGRGRWRLGDFRNGLLTLLARRRHDVAARSKRGRRPQRDAHARADPSARQTLRPPRRSLVFPSRAITQRGGHRRP